MPKLTTYVPRVFGGTLIIERTVSTIALAAASGIVTLATTSGIITFTDFGGEVSMTTTPPDDYSPRFAGDTSDPLQCFFTDVVSGDPYNLTGESGFTIKLRERMTGTIITGTGAWSLTNATGGQAVYTWAASDVATAGLYDLLVSVALPTGTKHFQPKPLEILPVW